MVDLYTSKYIPKSGGGLVECPKCGYNFKIELKCLRCGYIWIPKNPDKKPKVCPNPKCKSPYWNKPRKKEKNAVKNKGEG